MPTIGKIDPATSLPIRIDGPEVSPGMMRRTGPQPVLGTPRRRISPLVWAGVGALAVGLIVGGISAARHISPTHAISAEAAADHRSLANDQAPNDGNDSNAIENSRPASPPAERVEPPPAESQEEVLIGPLPAADTDGVEAVPHRRPRKTDRPPELKPNPYSAAL
jgi:hypothetical protein